MAIYEEFDDIKDDEESSFCNNGVSKSNPELRVKQCEQIIAGACEAWCHRYGSYSQLVLELGATGSLLAERSGTYLLWSQDDVS